MHCLSNLQIAHWAELVPRWAGRYTQQDQKNFHLILQSLLRLGFLNRKKIGLLLLMIFSGIYSVLSQNYKSVNHLDTIYYSGDPNVVVSSNYPVLRSKLRMTYIKNFQVQGSDTIFNFFNTVRLANPLLVPGVKCLDTLDGASWMGHHYIRKADGDEWYLNKLNEGILIKTQAHLGDTWTAITDSFGYEFRFTVSSIDTMTISQQVDSVKSFTLQAFSGGLPVVHFRNNNTFLLSKNHGWVKTYELNFFPYRGHFNAFYPNYEFWEEDTTCYRRIEKENNILPLNKIDMLEKFQIGSYWQYMDSMYLKGVKNYYDIYKDLIQDSVVASAPVTNDCRRVTLHRRAYNFHKYFTEADGTGIKDTMVVSMIYDTIICQDAKILYLNAPDTAFYPEDFLFDKKTYAANGWFFAFNTYYYYQWLNDSLPVFSLLSELKNGYYNGNCIVQRPPFTDFDNGFFIQYLRGFGFYGYFIHESANGFWNKRTIKHHFIKTGNIEIGSPIAFLGLSVGEIEQKPFEVFPNPGNGHYFISTPENGELIWNLFNTQGQLLQKDNNKRVIEITNLPNGIYILKLDFKGKTYFEKLVKQ